MTTQNDTSNAGPKPLEGSWQGENKILVAIDIGATQTGVAYTFLQKGLCFGECVKVVTMLMHLDVIDASKIIYRITKWPGQATVSTQCRIPTQIWYDTDGKVGLALGSLTHPVIGYTLIPGCFVWRRSNFTPRRGAS